MIVCQCNVLRDDALGEAIADLGTRREPAVITPGQVFKCCGVRLQCSGCMPLVTEVIGRTFQSPALSLAVCSLRRPAAYSRQQKKTARMRNAISTKSKRNCLSSSASAPRTTAGCRPGEEASRNLKRGGGAP